MWRSAIPVVLSATLLSVANNWPSVPAAKTGSPPVCPCLGNGCGRSVTTCQDLHILPAQSNRQYCRVAITNALAGVVVAGADPGIDDFSLGTPAAHHIVNRAQAAWAPSS